MARNNAGLAVVAVVAAVGIGAASYGLYEATHPERDVTATVTNHERVCDSHNSCKYLVYTSKGTFEITDSLVKMRFNSSDLYGQIQNNTTYDFHTRGVRVQFFSWYPNILTAKPVK
jgi:acyl CoA:acetate/3-ketoacid CoA transferase beta subunit